MSFKDFDDAVEAVEPIRFKLKGEVYELPGEIPASVVLMQLRSLADGGTINAMEWLTMLLGQETLDKMVQTGVSFPELVTLLNWLLQEYNLGEQVEERGEGDDTHPISVSVSSSSTGAS